MGKTVRRIIAGLALALVALLPPHAWAANFKVTTDPKKTCSAIEIEGEIKVGDYNRFVTTIKQAIALAPLRRLYLNSGGGNILTTKAITEVVRNSAPDIETIVQSGQFCNSACNILLTVGARRNISTEASIAIHQAFDVRTGKESPGATKKIGEYLVHNGMPPEVVSTMAALKPGELLQITPLNASKLGFGSFRFYGSSNPPATPHCTWDGFILNGP